MAKQRHSAWVHHECLRGLAVDALGCTLIGAAWVGAPAGTLRTTPVATALAVSVVCLDALGRG